MMEQKWKGMMYDCIGKSFVRKNKSVVTIVSRNEQGFYVDNNGWSYNIFGWCFERVEAKNQLKKVTDFDLQREAKFIEKLIGRKLL